MNGFDQPIRSGRDDSEGSLPRFRPPRLAKSCPPEQTIVCGVHLERFAITIDSSVANFEKDAANVYAFNDLFPLIVSIPTAA
jgi:hypothetical protein